MRISDFPYEMKIPDTAWFLYTFQAFISYPQNKFKMPHDPIDYVPHIIIDISYDADGVDIRAMDGAYLLATASYQDFSPFADAGLPEVGIMTILEKRLGETMERLANASAQPRGD